MRKNNIMLIMLCIITLILPGGVYSVNSSSKQDEIINDNQINLFYDGNPSLETMTPSGEPESWIRGGFGNNTPNFNYPVEGSDGPGSKAVEINVAQYIDGDVKLFPKNVVASGDCYFQDRYKSTVNTRILVRFSDGSDNFSYKEIAVVPSSEDWSVARGTFTVPADKNYVTIFHLIESNGSLTVDDYFLANVNFSTRGMVSVTIDDCWSSGFDTARPILNKFEVPATFYVISRFLGDEGRMTIDEILQLEMEGHEIGAHTRTHPDLTTLSAEQQRIEIIGAREDLIKFGVKCVSTFAYPFGVSNTDVENIVKTEYFVARSVDPGFNNRATYPYRLKVFNIEVTTTTDEVIDVIKQSVEDKTWLIIVWHQIDKKGGAFSMTPGKFKKCIKYLSRNDGDVLDLVTVEQGLYRLTTQ